MPFVLFYHDTLILPILLMYTARTTAHTTDEGFSSIQSVGYFYTDLFEH